MPSFSQKNDFKVEGGVRINPESCKFELYSTVHGWTEITQSLLEEITKTAIPILNNLDASDLFSGFEELLS